MSDLSYVRKRNQLIPEAEKYANLLNGRIFSPGRHRNRDAWICDWNRDFVQKMDQLAAKAGLQEQKFHV